MTYLFLQLFTIPGFIGCSIFFPLRMYVVFIFSIYFLFFSSEHYFSIFVF